MEALREMPDNAFDLICADPPYRDIEENQPFQQMRQAQSTKSTFHTGKPTNEFWEQIKRVSRNQIVFGANNFGIPFKGFIVWDKCVRGSDRYSQAEIASLSEGISTVSTIVKISTYTGNKIHPTQKPVALYRWIYQHYAKPGDKILDTHLGSGSSRIAAYDAGLDFVGYEIDKEYFDKQEKRFAEHSAQLNLFLGG
jgi:site-specific DNA-methyltransferase (adenine-specific)